MSTPEPFLEGRGLRKSFPDGQGPTPLLVLDNIWFAVAEGEFLAVVGPSGGGKSTLLRLLAGLVPPDGGEVRYRGERLVVPRRDIGYVFQRANLMPWRTVLRNIALPLKISHVPAPAAVAAARSGLANGPRRLRRSLPATAVRRHATAGDVGTCFDP